MALLTGTLKPGARMGPRQPTEALDVRISVVGGEARVGAFVFVTGTQGRSCYVQVCSPETGAFHEPFIDLDLDDPVPQFELALKHMGHRIRVIAKGTNPDGSPNGQDFVSNEIGPVLHATDPVGPVVSTPGEFDAALAGSPSTIVLAAGSIWSSDFLAGKNLSNLTITTPQDNPAMIRDTFIRPGNLTNVVLEGVILRHRAAWCTANRDVTMQTGTGTNGLTLRACKQIGDDVLPEVYQAIPATLAASPYAVVGMNFLAFGPDLWRSRNVTIEAHFARNVFWGLGIPHSVTVRHCRIDGWYFDGLRLNTSTGLDTDRMDVRDYYWSKCYGIYNEQNSAAPHMDPFQNTAGTLMRGTFDRAAGVVGNTRAKAFNGVVTNVIHAGLQRNMRWRMLLWTGRGSINTYMAGSDVSIDYMTKVQVGGGGGVIRFGGQGTFVGQFWSDEARIERSISREGVTLVSFPTSGYYVQNDSHVPASGVDADILEKIIGPVGNDPATLSDLALQARPRLGFEGLGSLTPSGHMKPYEPFPDAPSISSTPTPGGFNLTLGAVAGANRYEARWRPEGSTGAWERQVSNGTSFSATNLGSGVPYTVQALVRTAAGLSEWSAPVVVTSGTVAPVAVPGITWEPSTLGLLSQFEGATSAARTHDHPITFGAAPNGSTPRLSVAMLKLRGGVTGSTTWATHRFTDGSGTALLGDIAAIPGASIGSSPGANWRFLRIGSGTPAVGATAARLQLSSNSYSASYQRCGVWSAPVVDVASRAAVATSVTLSNVPPGSRIVAVCLIIGIAPGTWSASNGEATAPTVTLVDAQSDTSDRADSRVEVVTIEAPTGGNFTITCEGSTIVSAAAFAAA